MTVLRPVSPFKCRMWALHDRLGEEITAATCRELAESMSKIGQQVPAVGRQLVGDADYDVELIYGARRLFAARHLGIDLLVELRDIDDKAAAVLMDAENRIRNDISPYERGRSYRRWLRQGLFENQCQLARSLSVSEAQVSRLLKFADLPAVVLDAFRTPRDIREEWAVVLARKAHDAETRTKVLERARRCAKQKSDLSPKRVYDILTQQDLNQALKPRAHDEVIKDDHGKQLLRVSFRSTSVHLIIQRGGLNEATLKTITEGLKHTLQAEAGKTSNESASRAQPPPGMVEAMDWPSSASRG